MSKVPRRVLLPLMTASLTAGLGRVAAGEA